jgi:hypothetical protein
MKKTEEQRVCRRCRSIFMGRPEEFVCPTCTNNLERAEAKREKVRKQYAPPENPWLECLIQREGPTTVNVGGCQYTFRQNSEGHSVCLIKNPAHHKHLIKTGNYQPYDAAGL